MPMINREKLPFNILKYSNENFLGFNAEILNREQLVKWVAMILIAKYDHILKVISLGSSLGKIVTKKSVIDSVISNVLHACRDHRDGLLFQHISWVLSALQKVEGDILKAPHCRTADKGQDGIIIHFNGDVVSGVSICEDKATINVRDTVRDKVFPEIKEYEEGNRDSELESEVISLLKTKFNEDDTNSMIENIFWNSILRYRISITVDNEDPVKIFKDYENCIPGDKLKRTGVTVRITNNRNWFDSFATDVENYLKSLIGEEQDV